MPGSNSFIHSNDHAIGNVTMKAHPLVTILFLASILASALVPNGCGYTQLRRTESMPRPPSNPLEIFPSYDPVTVYPDTTDVKEPFVMIDTVASGEIPALAGGWDEERLMRAVYEQVWTEGADAVVDLRFETIRRQVADSPPHEYKIARGSLIKYFRTLIRPTDEVLRFRMPGELSYAISVEDIAGRSIEQKAHHLRNSYDLRVGDLPGGIYRVTFIAETPDEKKNRGVSWIIHWIVTRWLLIESKSPGM